MSEYLVCSGLKVLLPGCDNPSPASIVINKELGKISEVRRGQHTKQDLGLTGHSVEWIDAGDNIVLPGLIESVLFHGFRFLSLKTIVVHMFISMNRDAQNGRDFGRERELLLQGELRR